MIAEHQPKLFPPEVVAATSSIRDGSMRYPPKEPKAAENMKAWLPSQGIDPSQTVGLLITYGEDKTYTEIAEVTAQPVQGGVLNEKGWITADALVTNVPGLALLLPVADCIPTSFYDPGHRVIAIAHLGWHSTVHDLAKKLVGYLTQHYQTNPGKLLVHLGPSIAGESYIFNHLVELGNLNESGGRRWHQPPYATKQADDTYKIDLTAYNLDQLLGCGVQSENIEVAGIDTLQSEDYFSHTARKHPNKLDRSNGRFVSVIMMKP